MCSVWETLTGQMAKNGGVELMDTKEGDLYFIYGLIVGLIFCLLMS